MSMSIFCNPAGFFFTLLAIKCPLIWECVVRKLLLKGCKLFERLVACRRGGPLPVFGGDQPTIWTRIGIHSPSECDLPKVRILFIHFTQRRCWIMVVKEVWWQWLSAASVDFISLVNNGHNGWYLWVVPMVDCLLPIAISHYPHYCPCCPCCPFRCDFTLPIITLARLPPTLAPLCVSNYDCTPPTSSPQYQPFCKCGAHWQNCLCWGLLMPQKPPT